MVPLLTLFQEGPHQKLLFQGKIFFQNSASKMANCIIVDIVNYLLLLLATLSNSVSIFFHLNMELREKKKMTRK